ncbi:MAG: tol-pal system protein YbgF, partial [Gammaproteobacteria bacterium RIFCSPHIGHO2_12_FULL_45_9]
MNAKSILRMGLVLSLILVLGIGTAAPAPVEDISGLDNPPRYSDDAASPAGNTITVTAAPADSGATVIVPSHLTEDQRLARIEQQMNNLTAMNLPQQITELQQQLAELRGQLQMQSHDLKLLENQQRSFYQDLNQRLGQLKNSENTVKATTTPTLSEHIPSAPPSDPVSLKESQSYKTAFELVSKKEYDKAQTAFERYLRDYSAGQYSSNAHYWLGEIYSLQKKSAQASQEFKIVIEQFPKSSKISDAKLKLAILDAQAGKIDQAKRELQQIKKEYPDS